MNIPGLDTINNQILSLLNNNARLSYSDIADKIGGISRVSVKNRIEKMEEAGIIIGYEVKLNRKFSPDSVEFMVEIEATPEQYEYVLNKIS